MSLREQVAARPAAGALLQRKCSCGGNVASVGECESCRKKKQVQRRAAEDAAPEVAPPLVDEVLRAPGQSLDASTRAFFEPRFGHDFSKVRLHADSQAHESARSVNALAYTVGHDVAFASGRYAPASADGRRLLGHELAHVVQQSGGPAFSAKNSLAVAAPDTAAERQAEAAERLATAPMPAAAAATLSRFPMQIARQDDPAKPANGDAGGGSKEDLDKQTMNAADGARVINVTTASGRLKELHDSLGSGGTGANLTPTAAAVSKWLNIELNDKAFPSTVESARTTMNRNLTISSHVVKSDANDSDCATAYAYSFIGRPELNVRCCSAFFKSGPECRADVVTHEYFHLVGLHHGNEKAGPPPTPENRSTDTTAEALNSADVMSQLVSQIVRGTTDACPGR